MLCVWWTVLGCMHISTRLTPNLGRKCRLETKGDRIVAEFICYIFYTWAQLHNLTMTRVQFLSGVNSYPLFLQQLLHPVHYTQIVISPIIPELRSGWLTPVCEGEYYLWGKMLFVCKETIALIFGLQSNLRHLFIQCSLHLFIADFPPHLLLFAPSNHYSLSNISRPCLRPSAIIIPKVL